MEPSKGATAYLARLIDEEEARGAVCPTCGFLVVGHYHTCKAAT